MTREEAERDWIERKLRSWYPFSLFDKCRARLREVHYRFRVPKQVPSSPGEFVRILGQYFEHCLCNAGERSLPLEVVKAIGGVRLMKLWIPSNVLLDLPALARVAGKRQTVTNLRTALDTLRGWFEARALRDLIVSVFYSEAGWLDSIQRQKMRAAIEERFGVPPGFLGYSWDDRMWVRERWRFRAGGHGALTRGKLS